MVSQPVRWVRTYDRLHGKKKMTETKIVKVGRTIKDCNMFGQ